MQVREFWPWPVAWPRRYFPIVSAKAADGIAFPGLGQTDTVGRYFPICAGRYFPIVSADNGG